MKHSSFSVSSRGSALAVTIIFTMICAMLAFSVLRWSVTERRMNSRSALWLAARNASEGIAEYGFSQVRNDFETKATPGIYKPGTANALNLPNASVFSGTPVVSGAWNATTNPNGMEVIAGPVVQIPAGSGQYYVDPNDYNNKFDPQKGKWVFRQDVQVLARATVTTPNGAPVTHYMTETISVRGAPLFAHAIFYDGDIEMAPGPRMDIYGPVHSNKSLFITNQRGGGLHFHAPVTCVGAIFHAWSSNVPAAQGSGSEVLADTPMTFINAAGVQVDMNTGTVAAPAWKDSTMGASAGVSGGTPADPTATPPVAATGLFALLTPALNTSFRQYAAATWGGNVLTGASGVMPYKPLAFNEVIDAAGNTPNPHVLIDPPAPPLVADPYYAPKLEVEAQKKSMQAGLYIKVAVSAAGTATVSMYGPANSAPSGTPAAQIGPNGGFMLTPPTNCTAGSAAPSAATPPLVSYIPFRRLKTVVTVTKSGSTYTTKTDYSVLKPNNTVDGSKSVASTTTTSGSGTVGVTTSYSIYSDAYTGASYGYGLYDQRRGLVSASPTVDTPNAEGQIDLVQIDMAAVRALVTSMKNNTANANAITYTDPVSHTTKVWNNANAIASGIIPATQTPGAEKTPWNGAIYIDVQAPNSATPQQTTSVRLVNGVVPSGSSMIPSYGVNGIGLSIATNAPLYILGHFNADGTVDANSPTTPDDGKDGSSGNTSAESPIALAADAITVLSPVWDDTASLTVNNVAPNPVEIAAAFLVGIQPTTATNYSGGVHNLPRFLENWNSTVAIRGSLVTMFNCNIATQPWTANFYGAPSRQWGFNVLYQNGVYPPFTPRVMSYRRVDFADLTPAEYAAKKAALWP